MKRYLFLAAWVDGSESSYSHIGVSSPDDLLPCFEAGAGCDDGFIVLVIEGAPNEKVALAYGRAECWNKNMTAHDSVSDMIELDHANTIHGATVIKVDLSVTIPVKIVSSPDPFAN